MELREIKERIKDALSEQAIPILDGGKAQGDLAHYRGVTIDYIAEYLLEGDYSRESVARVVVDLLLESYLMAMPCNYAKGLMLTNFEHASWGWLRYKLTDEDNLITRGFGEPYEDEKKQLEYLQEIHKKYNSQKLLTV